MKKILIFAIILIINSTNIFGQSHTKIKVPQFEDEYSKTVSVLENGETDIDYKKFRESFLKSPQFKIAKEKRSKINELEKEIYKEMSNSNYEEIKKLTKEILSIDYTNMNAHKILRQTYKILEDSTNAHKYKTIQFGLLKSIVNNGDGKTCETAWPVIQVSEEYFILDMLDSELIEQNVDNNGGICDKMKVVNSEGEKSTYYFEISKVFEGRKNLEQ